jgi:hypothetical protein
MYSVCVPKFNPRQRKESAMKMRTEFKVTRKTIILTIIVVICFTCDHVYHSYFVGKSGEMILGSLLEHVLFGND